MFVRHGSSTGNRLFGDVSVEQLITALEEVSALNISNIDLSQFRSFQSSPTSRKICYMYQNTILFNRSHEALCSCHVMTHFLAV